MVATVHVASANARPSCLAACGTSFVPARPSSEVVDVERGPSYACRPDGSTAERSPDVLNLHTDASAKGDLKGAGRSLGRSYASGTLKDVVTGLKSGCCSRPFA